jgi:hypothetical protein
MPISHCAERERREIQDHRPSLIVAITSDTRISAGEWHRPAITQKHSRLGLCRGPRAWCTNDSLKVVERKDYRVILNEIWKELGEEEHGWSTPPCECPRGRSRYLGRWPNPASDLRIRCSAVLAVS